MIASATGYENDTDDTDEEGRPPHSVEIIVDGGDETSIASIILDKKAAGIQTFGSITVNVATEYGDSIPVSFNRPEYIYVWMKVTLDGKKDVIGMYVGENEGAKFWLSIINGLKNRGVQDILIACVDGLNGFPQAIEAVYPKTEIQQCIIHQIRNTTNYVSYKDLKKLMADLKMVYAAPDEAAALQELESFGEKWNSKYPKIYKSWSERWATLSTYFKYPNEVRKLIYTTNAIEGFNRQLRKVTKSRTVFPSDDSLLKMLYLATMDITKKWTGRRRDWSQIRAQLEIYFEERLEKAEF